MADEVLAALAGGSTSAVLAIFSYYAIQEMKQMRVEISALTGALYKHMGDAQPPASP